MEYGSIIHRASENWCYPVDENTIEVKIKTGYDIKKVAIYHGDPFERGILGGNYKWNGERLEIIKNIELQHHKLWIVRITPKYKRLKYYFEIETDNEKILYFEDGFYTKEEAIDRPKQIQCFTLPWLNNIDVINTPSWVKDTVWYQIFPDRFCKVEGSNDVIKWNSKRPTYNDIFGGNIQGIMSKLEYLKNLGISGIYLNPIFKAGSNHKYDTIDYYSIDPMFGDKELFRCLVEECHKKNIKVMIDGVFNHSGKDFPMWQDVLRNGKKSKYFDWFMVNEWPIDKDKRDTRDGKFYSFAFTSNMPKLNTNNKDVIEYITRICEYWIQEFDIDGWRFDVANEISHKLCKEINRRCKLLKPDIYLLGEIWHDSIKWLEGDEFDAVMNYPLKSSIEDFWVNENMTNKDFEHLINNCYQRYMYQINESIFNLLDSHDTDRIYSRVGENKDIFYQQLGILFTMAGSPCIYYGTEIALPGEHDPDCRRCMDWDGVESHKYDNELTLMKQLITMKRENKACSSQDIIFENNHNNRVIEYIKDNDIKIIVNASIEDIKIEDINNDYILFKNQYEKGIVKKDGIVIYKI